MSVPRSLRVLSLGAVLRDAKKFDAAREAFELAQELAREEMAAQSDEIDAAVQRGRIMRGDAGNVVPLVSARRMRSAVRPACR